MFYAETGAWSEATEKKRNLISISPPILNVKWFYVAGWQDSVAEVHKPESLTKKNLVNGVARVNLKEIHHTSAVSSRAGYVAELSDHIINAESYITKTYVNILRSPE